MPRVRAFSLFPVFALGALAFGLIFVYIGVEAARGGAPVHGTAIAVFGALGVALAVALWRTGRRVGARPDGQTRGEGG